MLWAIALCTKVSLSVCSVLWVYNQLTRGTLKSNKTLHGKVAIVTGGNTGIGLETAKDLAKRGARVVIASRNMEKGNKAVDEIKTYSANEAVEVMQLDLNTFKSVLNFIQQIKKTLPQVDLLVNNAGAPPLKETDDQLSEDNYDRVLQTNYFSTFLLTVGLKDMLEKSDSPRIINVSSMAQMFVGPGVDYDAIRPGKTYPVNYVYGCSKLMLTTFTYEIARRWESIQAFSLHPGFVRTEIFSKSTTFNSLYIYALSYLVGRNVYQGAQTSLFCCIADGLVNGEYYADCRLAKSYLKNKTASDPEKAKQLWRFSESLLSQHLETLRSN